MVRLCSMALSLFLTTNVTSPDGTRMSPVDQAMLAAVRSKELPPDAVDDESEPQPTSIPAAAATSTAERSAVLIVASQASRATACPAGEGSATDDGATTSSRER